MEELNKKDILTLIGENITSIRHSGYKGFDEGIDLEEMPIYPGHSAWPTSGKEPDPNKPAKSGKDKGNLPKWTRLYETDEEGKIIEHVGWYGRNPDTDEAVPIIYTCNWDEFMEKHPDLVPKLKEKFGDVNLIEDVCPDYKPRGDIKSYGIKPIPGSDKVVKVTNTQYTPGVDDEGNFKTTYTREKINRVFNNTLKEYLQSQDAIDGLKKLSLPAIVIDNDKHRNRRSSVNNEEIRFESHNINLYETQGEFSKHVIRAIKARNADDIPDKGNKHLRRLYNTEYNNWSKTRFTKSGGQGKTPVFKLDKGDFPNEQDFQVMVSADVKVIGKAIEKNENDEITKWGWEITYLAEYAKKAPTDRIATQRNKDLEIVKSLSVDLSEPKKFDGKNETDLQGNIESGDRGDNHPLTDVNIMTGLKQVLEEFVNEIKNTDPKSAIRKSINTIAQLGGREAIRQQQGNLNEDHVRELVRRVIKQNK